MFVEHALVTAQVYSELSSPSLWRNHAGLAGPLRHSAPLRQLPNSDKACSNQLASPLIGGLTVALFTATLLFARLDYPLLEPDETRYALIPLTMIQQGNWLIPQLHGKPYNDKPPFLYWLTALSYQAFGVHDWTARLPSAVATWLTVLIIYGWLCYSANWRVAVIACTVLSTMAGFLVIGRMLLLDSVLTLFTTVSLCAGHIALTRCNSSELFWLVSAFCTGIGVLTKGPVAIILTTLPLALYQQLDRCCPKFSLRRWVLYFIASLTIAIPWYIYIGLQSDSFVTEFFWRHHVMRFLKPYHHLRPWWFYFPILLLELLPWLIWPATKVPQKHFKGPLCFCWIIVISCFAFFSLSRCKLPTYLMPMLPFCATLIGAHIVQQKMKRSWYLAIALSSLLLPATLWWGMPWYASIASTGGDAANLRQAADALGTPVVAYRDDWSSAVFYSCGEDLKVFSHEDLPALENFLRQHPTTVVLARNHPISRSTELQSFLRVNFTIVKTICTRHVTAFVVEPSNGKIVKVCR
jgi:4-amino-4-deoxy-L-arabinose transferase-like glycosyltransferase